MDKLRTYCEITDRIPACIFLLTPEFILHANPHARDKLRALFPVLPIPTREFFNHQFITKLSEFSESNNTFTSIEWQPENFTCNKSIENITLSKTGFFDEGLFQMTLTISPHDDMTAISDLLNQLDDIFFTLDPEFKFTSIHSRSLTKSDFPKSDIIGRKFDHIFNIDNPALHLDMLRNALAGERVIYEWTELFRNRRRYYQTTMLPIIAGSEISGVAGCCKDISRFRILENDQRDKLGIYEKFVRNSADGIVIVDSTGVIIEWNKASEALFGIAARDALGKFVWDIQYRYARPEEREIGAYQRVRTHTLKMLEMEGSEFENTNYEREIVCPDGEHKTIQTIAFKMKSERDNMLASINRDVTKRRLIEEKLRDSEEKYRQLVSNLNEGIWVIDDEGLTTYVNEQMANMLGYTTEEMLGRGLFDFMTPEMIEKAQEKFESRKSGMAENHEFEFRHKSGSPVYTILATSPLKDSEGNFVGAIAGILNVTDKKTTLGQLEYTEKVINIRNKAARELISHKSADVFRHILTLIISELGINTASLGYIGEENDFFLYSAKIRSGNPKITESSVIAKDRIPDKWKESLKDRKVIFSQPEGEPDITEMISPIFEGDNTEGILSFTDIKSKFDGSTRNLINSISGFLAPMMRAFRYRFVEENRRKEAERKLEKLNSELENQVSARTRELEQARSNLSKALDQEKELNEMKTKFMSIISHEYRTPITIIQSSAQLMQRLIYTSRLDEKSASKYLIKIINSSRRLNDLIDEVLIVGRADSKKLEYHPKEFALEDFIRESVESAALLECLPGQIEIGSISKNGNINTDPNLLRHIVVNALANACKFSDDDSKVTITAVKTQGELIIEITDRGEGIPEKEIKLIFEPFYRATNAENLGGVGLGLAIAKRCADRLDANISIKSKLGEGTTFSIRVPLD